MTWTERTRLHYHFYFLHFYRAKAVFISVDCCSNLIRYGHGNKMRQRANTEAKLVLPKPMIPGYRNPVFMFSKACDQVCPPNFIFRVIITTSKLTKSPDESFKILFQQRKVPHNPSKLPFLFLNNVNKGPIIGRPNVRWYTERRQSKFSQLIAQSFFAGKLKRKSFWHGAYGIDLENYLSLNFFCPLTGIQPGAGFSLLTITPRTANVRPISDMDSS